LFLILLSTQLLKSLAAVASGKVPLDFLFALIGLKNLESLTLILPLTLFLGILLALSRLYKDSEMVALSACGIGPLTLLQSVLIILFTFIFLQLGLALVISPWASQQIQYQEVAFELEAEIELITPGQFNLSNDGKRVLYAEDMPTNTSLANVFLHLDNEDSSSVLSSVDANIVIDERHGARYIVFQEGNRYDGKPGSLDYRHITFNDYGVLLAGKAPGKINFDREAVPTSTLIKSEQLNYKAELQWRISQVLMMIILALIAVPLSKSTPRQGRYAKMALAILIYIIYSNLLVAAMSWVRKGQVEPYIGIWWVHLLFFIIFLILFFRQMGWIKGINKNKQDLSSEEFAHLVKD
jgi:lipopolysaccharide export system permease protein